MPARHIVYTQLGRNRIFAGVNALAGAVRVGLGPRAGNVVIDSYGSPTIENHLENMGAQSTGSRKDRPTGRSARQGRLPAGDGAF